MCIEVHERMAIEYIVDEHESIYEENLKSVAVEKLAEIQLYKTGSKKR